MPSSHRVSRIAAAICCAFGLLYGGAPRASDIDPSTLALLRDLKPLTDDLARYRYLLVAMHKLPLNQRLVAKQLLATTESELGLYSQALRDFPIDSRKVYSDPLPAPSDWQAVDAATAITRLAAGRRLVLINEAHHDPHTRELTLALLPRLKAAGFTHFAVEALGDEDTELAKRGYPLTNSGSEYLHEPLYGELVRRALQLGFVVVPYESDNSSTAGRETGQAKNLYKRVLADHPQARLFVHAGYAHIDKAKGRLGWAAPMAAELARLSGIEPLSIDQTQFREANPRVPHAAYDQLVANFHPTVPVVLERKPEAGASGPAAWTSDPALHDVSVILPPDGNAPKDAKAVPGWYTLDGALIPAKPPGEDEKRPDWLGLGGQRLPLAVDGGLCKEKFPCLVEAFYAKESDTAVAADRFAFLDSDAQSALYLFPGDYRVRVRDADGKVLEERAVTVARTPAK
ncbi:MULTISPECIES: hypothetical protein [unclassified Dyella]|uniref:hypothetical protein n=1 Tax=unclassified Dyella TaxID=2634549 RepID=UPI002032433C|nr:MULTISPECIES: hypothetical protein [unclassified Dyella]